MRTPDLIIPASQREGHVSKETQDFADKIYDPHGDPETEVKKLLHAIKNARDEQAGNGAPMSSN